MPPLLPKITLLPTCLQWLAARPTFHVFMSVKTTKRVIIRLADLISLLGGAPLNDEGVFKYLWYNFLLCFDTSVLIRNVHDNEWMKGHSDACWNSASDNSNNFSSNCFAVRHTTTVFNVHVWGRGLSHFWPLFLRKHLNLNENKQSRCRTRKRINMQVGNDPPS